MVHEYISIIILGFMLNHYHEDYINLFSFDGIIKELNILDTL